MSADTEAVSRANQGFYDAFEALEMARMDAVWAHDGQVSCAHPGWPLADGWAAVRRSWETIFTNTQRMSFTVDDERVDVRGELAWVVCIERITSERQAGALLATNVFRRHDGQWLMVHHHASPFVPSSAPRSEVLN